LVTIVEFPPTSAPLARALTDRGYNEPTPVQAAVLGPDVGERDLLVSAQTGSGKTVAYGLALGSTLLGQAEALPRPGDPLALIVAPTRELALQVQRELAWLYESARAKVVSCVGGMDPRREQRELAAGAHIVVGTPGRLRDHLERGRLNIGALKAVVLDEADEMLDLGFSEDLEFILGATPQNRRTLLFSATLPRPIVSLAGKYQRDALRIQVKGGADGHADIEYRAVRVAPNEIEHAVVNLLRYVDAPSALVFCNTRESVRHLQAILLERGFSVVALSGELSQNDRNHAMQALRDGRARVCVATDVAARGIDLPSLGLVIHAELPHDAEVLQHRSGRTGRAGRKGVSVLLVPFSRRRKAERLMVDARVVPVWSGPPLAEEIRRLDEERLLSHPLLTGEKTEEDAALAATLLAARSPEDIAIALARLYRAQLPAPEDVFDPAERDAAPRRQRDSAPERGDRAPRGPAATDRPTAAPRSRLGGRSVWFRLDVGRDKNADPRWLLPMICRQGMVTKQDIGAIRIFDTETRFEIDEDAAERFIEATRRVKSGEVRIERLKDDLLPGEAGRVRNPLLQIAPVRERPAKQETVPPRPRATRPGAAPKWEPRPKRFDKARDGAKAKKPKRF